jgi:hypothetical protein
MSNPDQPTRPLPATQMTTATPKCERSSVWTSISAGAPYARRRASLGRPRGRTHPLSTPHTKGEADGVTRQAPLKMGCFRRGGCRSSLPELSAFSQLRSRAGTGCGNEAYALAQGGCLTACLNSRSVGEHGDRVGVAEVMGVTLRRLTRRLLSLPGSVGPVGSSVCVGDRTVTEPWRWQPCP